MADARGCKLSEGPFRAAPAHRRFGSLGLGELDLLLYSTACSVCCLLPRSISIPTSLHPYTGRLQEEGVTSSHVQHRAESCSKEDAVLSYGFLLALAAGRSEGDVRLRKKCDAREILPLSCKKCMLPEAD